MINIVGVGILRFQWVVVPGEVRPLSVIPHGRGTAVTWNVVCRVNKIEQRSPMPTKKSQPEGKWIMPEKRFNKYQALSFDSRVGLSQSTSVTND